MEQHNNCLNPTERRRDTICSLPVGLNPDVERNKQPHHQKRITAKRTQTNEGRKRSWRNGFIGRFPIWILSMFFLSSLVAGQRSRNPALHSVELQCADQVILQSPINIPMRTHQGMPIVDVWIGKDGPFSFAIDTGAMHPVIIDSSLAEQLGSTVYTSRQDTDATTMHQEVAEPVIDSMRVGNAVFQRIPTKLGSGFREFHVPIDGILGFSLFRDLLLTLDYPGKCIRIEQAELPDSNVVNILPLEEHSTGLAFVQLLVNGDTLSALLDTGNLAAAFYLPRDLVNRLKWVNQTAIERKAHTVAREILLEEVQLAGSIQLGPFTFNKPVVVFGDVFGRAIIGGKALEGHVVSIDQRNRRLRLER